MDERTVSRATERWVEAGVIDEETAVAIRGFEAPANGIRRGDTGCVRDTSAP